MSFSTCNIKHTYIHMYLHNRQRVTVIDNTFVLSLRGRNCIFSIDLIFTQFSNGLHISTYVIKIAGNYIIEFCRWSRNISIYKTILKNFI